MWPESCKILQINCGQIGLIYLQGAISQRWVLRVGWTELYQTWMAHRAILSALSKHGLVFRYIAPFPGCQVEILYFRYIAPLRNHSASKATGVENRGQISHILPPIDLGEVGEISEWILRVQSMTKPVLYYWRGVSWPSGRLEGECQKKTITWRLTSCALNYTCIRTIWYEASYCISAVKCEYNNFLQPSE